jgi:hypothetical protein
MMAKRKRASGGGRKRLGPSIARNLTIRIDDDLRGQLHAAAIKRAERKRGWNLSREILLRLRCSLDKEREHRRSAAMRALCDLISDMAKRELHTDRQQSWHQDLFTFRAFKFAVAKLLDELEPVGEMRPPPALAEVFKAWGPLDAERLGEHAAFKALTALRYASPLPAGRAMAERYFMAQMGAGSGGDMVSDTDLTMDEFEEQLHSWPRIRRALGIEEPKEDTQ